jgi:hypothetical protein
MKEDYIAVRVNDTQIVSETNEFVVYPAPVCSAKLMPLDDSNCAFVSVSLLSHHEVSCSEIRVLCWQLLLRLALTTNICIIKPGLNVCVMGGVIAKVEIVFNGLVQLIDGIATKVVVFSEVEVVVFALLLLFAIALISFVLVTLQILCNLFVQRIVIVIDVQIVVIVVTLVQVSWT